MLHLEFPRKLYADDSNIFIHGKNFNELQDKRQNALNLITNWMLANRLTVNIQKTFFTLVFPHSNLAIPSNVYLYINSAPINRAESVQFLCVMIINSTGLII